ncbi:pseudouridine-5'-phosphatase-like isoform X2 [Planococcus citri]|uniref:pseudouridine-5'-phosphatase-like isoform X2 n=1 Tax=Planococcus citri TaxID=170843 RepID=UPI0031F78EFF
MDFTDTESIYFKLDFQVCAKYGKEFTHAIKEKLLGTTEFRSAEIIIEELDLPVTVQEYVDQVKKMLLEVVSNVDLMPGAEKLMRHLNENNITFAVATGASYQMYLLKIQKNEKLFSLVDHVTAASSDPDVKHGKPAPDVFLVCAERFKDQPHPSKCLVFEDAPGGVIAAVRAGMQVVMVPDEYISDHLKQEATLVLKSLEDFRPEWFGLPPYPELKG